MSEGCAREKRKDGNGDEERKKEKGKEIKRSSLIHDWIGGDGDDDELNGEL